MVAAGTKKYGRATLIERSRRGTRHLPFDPFGGAKQPDLPLGQKFLKKRKGHERVDRFWLIEAEPHVMIRLKRIARMSWRIDITRAYRP